MQATLALEDGRIFRGKGYGAKGECYGEVVFNTSITGYQEIFTDPSYAGQIVVLTNPEIGNYGTNPEDNEATRPYIEGLIVREFSRVSSNWRSQQVAEEYLEQFKIPVLGDIDTRALVRHLRDNGVMRGVVSTIESDSEKLVTKARSIPKMDGTDLAKVVSTSHTYVWETGERSHLPDEVVGVKDEPVRFHVVAYDYGIKQSILRKLRGEGCKVTVVPAETQAEDVLALKPDGVFLSNGPGDPEPCTYAVDNIRRLMGRQPIFGICLGHQLTGIALGGKTFKLKFGHHGGNHPVKQLQSGKIEITAHNHNFAVDPDSLPQSEVELTHIDLNDNTLEGMRHRNLPLFTVQYHPEASPGPHEFALPVQGFREDDGGVQAVTTAAIPKSERMSSLDLSALLPRELLELGDLQTAIPRIAKDPVLSRLIRETVERIPTRHTLVHGDARRMSDALVGKAHLVLTSPPYWTLKQYRDTAGQMGHITDYDEFLVELDRVWQRCFDLLVPGGRLVCVVGDVCLSRKKNEGRHTVVPLHASIQEHCRKIGFDNLAPIIWHKIANAAYEVENGGGGFLGKPYEPNAVIKNDTEFVLMQRKPGGYRNPTEPERILSVISAEDHRKWFQQIWTGLTGASTRDHPAPYPVELAERLVRMFSFVGDTVLDPFMGTGTTALASSKWGRNSISFEIDPTYLDFAAQRLHTELSTLFSRPVIVMEQE